MSTCLCSDEAAVLCSGGGHPLTQLGCPCACHRGATGLAARVRVYLLAQHVHHVSLCAHAQLALDVCGMLAGLSPRDRSVALATLGATGCAEPLVAALMRTALLWARARTTAGILAAGGVP